MNKPKQYIKKIFQRTDFAGLSVFGRGQQFDWEMLLTLFLVVMVVAVIFSVHIFLGVKAGDIFTDGFKPQVHNETINRNALDRVLKDFATRAETLKNLQTSRPVFVDPSL